eukprot:85794_1
MGQSCCVIMNHSSRKREETTRTKQLEQSHIQDSGEILLDILNSCLSSLHCYLLHDRDELYRINKQNDDENQIGTLRFRTDLSPLQFTDEIDSFIELVREKTDDNEFIFVFMNWIFLEQYDW